MKFLVLAALISLNCFSADCVDQKSKWVGTIESSKLDEISGITFSKLHAGVIYAHNDSGGKARLYTLNSSGKKIGSIKIEGAKNIDWEDITTMSCPGEVNSSCIAIGDIGNNRFKRKKMTIYIVKEPKEINLKKQTLRIFKKINFKLNTKDQNFESLFSFKDELFLISKMDSSAGSQYPGEEGRSILYKLDQDKGLANSIGKFDLLKTEEFYKLDDKDNKVLKVPNYYAWATGAELDSTGKKLYLLTYGTIFEFSLGSKGLSRPDLNNYRLIKIPNQPQVEALSLNKDQIFVVSEYLHQPLYQISCQ